MDHDDLYAEAQEKLKQDLGREPTDEEINDWIVSRISGMADDAYERARERDWE